MRKISKTESVEKLRFIATLFGEPGVGKTTLSFTAPKPLFFDFDRGVHRAAQNIRPDYYQIENFGMFWDYLLDEYQTPDGPMSAKADIESEGYETFILDTAGSMLDDFMAPWLMSKNPSYSQGAGLSLRGWGAMKTMFNQLKARVQELGVNLLFIAHDKDEGGESIRKVPSLSGGSADILKRASDMIMWIGVKGNKKVVSAEPSHLHIGKNIIGMPDLAVPHVSSEKYLSFISDIFKAMEKKMLEQSDAQVKAREVLKGIFSQIEKAKKPTHFDAITKEIGEIKQPSLVAQVRKKMRQRLEEVNIVFDKKKKAFTWAQVDEPEPEHIEPEANDGEMSEADWEGVKDPHAE
jgi:hypothetical protein